MSVKHYLTHSNSFLISHMVVDGIKHLTIHKLFSCEDQLLCPDHVLGNYKTQVKFCGRITELHQVGDSFFVHVGGLRYLYVGSFIKEFNALNCLTEFSCHRNYDDSYIFSVYDSRYNHYEIIDK